jgi:Protein of unknown function (DUF3185)
MNKFVSLAVLTGGVVLLDLGIGVMNSFSSGVSRLLTGLPADKTVWMLIGGIVATVLGMANLLRRPEETREGRGNTSLP